MGSPPLKSLRYRFGLFTLDAVEGTLSRDGKRVKLQDLPCRLLVMLVERPGEIVTREEMRQCLWPENTFVEFDNSLGVAIRKVRDSLDDDRENPRFIETVPRRGYRFLAPVHADAAPEMVVEANRVVTVRPGPRSSRWGAAIAIGIAVAALVIAGLLWRYRTQAGPTTEPVSLVVGDFANYTGESALDGSLRRAAIIELGQSPYLTILPDGRVRKILQYLGRSPDDTLSPALARDVCRSGRASASITGSIRSSAGAYLISMEADRCADGTALAQQTMSAPNKQHVLTSLGTMIVGLRHQLGESRESLQTFNVPIDQASTNSLDALKAYQLGLDLRVHMKSLEARPAFKTAIALDPDFAIAYAQLGSSYSNLGNTAESKQYFQKAFSLRARVTEPERLYITGRYFDIVTGETEKGAETYTLWTEMYPNEWLAYVGLANDSNQLGRYETVVQSATRANELGPNQDFGSSILVGGLIALNRLDEAKKICDQMIAQGHDESFIHVDLLQVAYLQQDQQLFNRELEWAEQHQNSVEATYARAQAAAAMGKIQESTKLFEQAAKLTIANEDKESAANALATAAEINSEVGLSAIALKESNEALKLGENEIVLGLGGIVAARAHDMAKAQELLSKLEHDYPLSTFNLRVFSPMIRTMIDVSQKGSPAAVTALMEPDLLYEFGDEADMVPVYIRGVSYLQVRSAPDAQREFQKLIDHHSMNAFSTLYPLSYLGLARACALQGKLNESRAAYDRFFVLWKDADKNLPIFLQAGRESHELR
jgi:DNA-binding winged helix-turn-helix (wHTH) protein/tetratricopeptide (TPR) repeat protein